MCEGSPQNRLGNYWRHKKRDTTECVGVSCQHYQSRLCRPWRSITKLAMIQRKVLSAVIPDLCILAMWVVQCVDFSSSLPAPRTPHPTLLIFWKRLSDGFLFGKIQQQTDHNGLLYLLKGRVYKRPWRNLDNLRWLILHFLIINDTCHETEQSKLSNTAHPNTHCTADKISQQPNLEYWLMRSIWPCLVLLARGHVLLILPINDLWSTT